MPKSLLVKNTLSQIVSRVVFVLISFLLVRILTENLGVGGYGVYAFVTALVLFFANFADWGMQVIAVREASKVKDPKVIFTTALSFRFILSLVTFVLINVVVRLYQPWHEFVSFVTIGSLVLFPLSVKTSLSIILQTFLRLDKNSIVELVGGVGFFLATILLLGLLGLNGVFVAWVMGTSVAAVAGIFFARRYIPLRISIDRVVLAKLVRESLPMGALLLVFSLYNRVDIVILEHFRGAADVGIYNLAYKVHENLILGAAFLMNTLFPVFSRKFERKEELRSIFRQALVVITLLGATVAILFFFLSPAVVSVLTGPRFLEFDGSVLALRILLFATFVSYLNHLMGFSLVAFSRQGASLLIGVGALFFNVAGNVLFIPQFSFVAAALITGITEVFVFVLSSIVVFRTLKLKI